MKTINFIKSIWRSILPKCKVCGSRKNLLPINVVGVSSKRNFSSAIKEGYKLDEPAIGWIFPVESSYIICRKCQKLNNS